MSFKPTIGLEVHVELKTRTKMFCACLNNPDEKKPNVNVCPICLGHPGTLPVINKKAVDAVLKLGMALKGKITRESHFDRKSYFYPDLPKGYQISQYEHPLVEGGTLNNIRIRRIHLEEDTGRLLHSIPNYQLPITNYSLVDFNRAGVPLMELVTEPDIKSAEEAVNFAKELQLILRYLDISGGDMEKGQLRVEANISISKEQSAKSKELGTKVEVKNINSFKAVFGAIEYELKRQEKAAKEGGEIIQETRGWNDKKGITESQRTKESSHDYRYFPEPDLPPIHISVDGRASPVSTGGPPIDEINIESLKLEIPELPEAKRSRFIKEFGLSREQVEVLIEDKVVADYYESAVSELKTYEDSAQNFKLLYNYLTSDLRGIMNQKQINFQNLKTTPEHLAHLIFLINKGELSSRMAKDTLIKMVETGLDPEEIVKESGHKLISNEDELIKIVKEIIEENPNAVSDYKKGKEASIQFLIGKAMAKLKGRGEPNALKELFIKNLQ